MTGKRLMPLALIGTMLATIPAAPADADWRDFKLFRPKNAAEAGDSGSIRIAQSRDDSARVSQLEEIIRQLNGKIEDLNFQLLQMQEELRRMQEDNELRFQELESKRGIKGAARVTQRQERRQPATTSQDTPPAGGRDGSIAQMIGRGQEPAGSPEAEPPARQDDEIAGLQPQALGTLTFDQQGNLVDSEIEKPIDLTRRGFGADDSAAGGAAGLGDGPQYPDDPQALYDAAYGYVQAGSYEEAENAFNEFISRYPQDEHIGEARFWLGESIFAQGQYEDAARIFLETHKKYPNSRMAPQTLLKLGVSLAGMNQRELACATFAEVPKKYPNLSNAVRVKLASEQKASSCAVN